MRTPIMSCCRLMAAVLFLFCSMPLFAQRQDILLNDNWKFRFSHQVQKGSEIRVDLPHTWNAQDALSGKIDYKRGSCLFVPNGKASVFSFASKA